MKCNYCLKNYTYFFDKIVVNVHIKKNEKLKFRINPITISKKLIKI